MHTPEIDRGVGTEPEIGEVTGSGVKDKERYRYRDDVRYLVRDEEG